MCLLCLCTCRAQPAGISPMSPGYPELKCAALLSQTLLQDMATEDKQRVNLEIAAMDPEKKAAIEKAAADARAAKKQKKTDKTDKVHLCVAFAGWCCCHTKQPLCASCL